MTTVEDIENQLRAWFEELQAERFDEKIEHDARAGKLDRLAEDAIRGFQNGPHV